MTIEKATTIMRTYWKQPNIKSWCQKVLALLDLMFLDYLELNGTFPWTCSPLFLQMREEISEQFEKLVKLVDFMEYFRYFQVLPKPRNPSHANSETKKV